ncbi:MAG: hypothetical protein ABI620_05000 [Chloroflexota bacterium]
MLSAAMVLGVSAGAVFAAKPAITIIDFSQFEPFAEADWSASVEDGGCGFAVDVEFEGRIIIHEFNGQRLVEVDNWRTFMSYSANGKTFVAAHPVAGPDHFWIGADGTSYRATTGRSPFDGLIGRIVRNDDTDTLVSSHGRVIDNPIDDICAAIAP